ncbi:hypothetical protein G7Y89_g11633 [Cudoniella acicularis]|uniref:Glucose-methanol-choline oxidoreductase N-terminal domain-containing protein n=1 Tax=Cudoniella acicularis TaxID=354080 RepID=A0A8H4RAG8_9HELO|nr:hypothetical protein G7Y89_g11633 [Cudoniella acicularis]
MQDGTRVASGVELADGRTISANKEVVISAGTIRTPQLLLLSGIGPKEELDNHGIEQVVESPEVGKNLWDHFGLMQTWKLRHPEIGASLGSTAWIDSKFMNGNLIDWWVNQSVSKEELSTALELDGESVEGEHSLLRTPRCYLGLFVHYVRLPLDGSVISTWALDHIPTSRGSVTLSSKDIEQKPIIDHNHYATEADRYRIRTGTRTIAKILNTLSGKEIAVGEVLPDGIHLVLENLSDEDINARICVNRSTIQHPAGTASMGKVVDTRLRRSSSRGAWVEGRREDLRRKLKLQKKQAVGLKAATIYELADSKVPVARAEPKT